MNKTKIVLKYYWLLIKKNLFGIRITNNDFYKLVKELEGVEK